MPNSLADVTSEKAEALPGALKKYFRVDSEFVMSALKLCFLIQAVLAMPALAQTPSEQNSPLPSQAKQVHGLAVPVPKEIFRSLDQFRDANWRGIKRPEVARWKSHGDQAQIATLLGVVTAEGFIAMEAEDSAEVKNIGNRVLALARGLGIERARSVRCRSIIDLADKEEWNEARKEWDRVFSDLESGMIETQKCRAIPAGNLWRMVARDRGSIGAGNSELFSRACRTHSPTGSG